jgi:hypothetical protein
VLDPVKVTVRVEEGYDIDTDASCAAVTALERTPEPAVTVNVPDATLHVAVYE